MNTEEFEEGAVGFQHMGSFFLGQQLERESMQELRRTAWKDGLADQEESAAVHEAVSERHGRNELFASTKRCLIGRQKSSEEVAAEVAAEGVARQRQRRRRWTRTPRTTSPGAFDAEDPRPRSPSRAPPPLLPQCSGCRGHSGDGRAS